MSDAREKFLKAIAGQVPVDRVVDVHLFPPIRQGGTESGVAVVAVELEEDAVVGSRHTVFVARYRLTLKGPERGRWEFDAVAEADAPLVSVAAVVRGVQDRAGDLSGPERLSGDELRALAVVV